jgi:hypothetical protein
MASSIYIYTNKNDYDNLYKGKQEAYTYETPILDFFIRPTEGYDVEDSIYTNKLWVVTQTDKVKMRPSLERTIVHFTNGTCFEFCSGSELQVQKEKVFYNPKNNQLEFYPRMFRTPLLSLKVDKVIGGKPTKKSKIKYRMKYYDMTHDRLNLFV